MKAAVATRPVAGNVTGWRRHYLRLMFGRFADRANRRNLIAWSIATGLCGLAVGFGLRRSAGSVARGAGCRREGRRRDRRAAR